MRKGDETRIGNKANNVAALLRLGVSTPPGYCVSSEAYREFLERSKLEKQLIALARGAATKSIPQLEEASQKIARLMLSKPVPIDIREEIVDAYEHLLERLGDVAPWVAVRSSATMEDTPKASFAGQHDSFLYVSGAAGVVSHTVKCWASLWSPQAMHYRDMNGFAHSEAAMGVLVQQMVPATASGVLFTADPINNDRATMVIGAGWGLGEGIASGTAGQDTFMVDKKRFRIRERVIADKQIMVTKGEGEGTRGAPVPDALRHTPCLSDPQVKELATLGLRLEEHFGAPQDVEWAVREGHAYILQSRPITTLEPTAPSTASRFPIRWESEEDKRGYWMWAQREQPKPLSPLAQSVIFSYRWKGVHAAFETLAMPFHSHFRAFNGYYYMGRVPVAGTAAETTERSRRHKSQLKKHRDSWEREYLPEVLQHITYMKHFDLAGASMEALLNHLDSVLAIHERHWFIHFMAGIPMVAVRDRFIETVVSLTGMQDPLQAYKLLQGFDNKSVEANRELWCLSLEAKKSPTVRRCFKENGVDDILRELETTRSGQRFVEKLYGYLKSYGDRLTTGTDCIEPTLKEAPAYFLTLLKGYLETPAFDHLAMERKVAAERDAAIAEAYVRIGPSETKRRRFTRELARAQKLVPFHEDHTFFIDQMDMAQMRYVFLEFGDRLCAAGVLAHRDDIFFLTVEEVQNAARHLPDSNWRPVVRNRKRQRRKWLQLSPPPWVGTPPAPEKGTSPGTAGWYYQGHPMPGANLLRGLPGSPGIVKGKARIVHAIEEFAIVQPGDILVCPSILPPWTPLFSLIAGLVTNTGAALMHDAIIAREYGIPAVVGTKIATKIIANGQLIGVDGTVGVVHLY
jgi:pyruvate,water dikinase